MILIVNDSAEIPSRLANGFEVSHVSYISRDAAVDAILSANKTNELILHDSKSMGGKDDVFMVRVECSGDEYWSVHYVVRKGYQLFSW
jgi:hypothetical protein